MRGARDSALASLALERQKTALEYSQIQELRQLANSRRDRIKSLESEVERFKVAIAEGKGYSQLLSFFGRVEEDGGRGADPWKVMESRLEKAESECKAAQQVISELEQENREKAEVC